MAQKIQFRRDTAANWTSVNPILSQGELGYETNTGKFKIGNGIQYWNEQTYFSNGAASFAELTGQIGETQLPTNANAVVIPTHLRSSNNGATGQVLSIDNVGRFEWVTINGAGNLSLVASTGNYGDLNGRPTFSTGNTRPFDTPPQGPGTLVEAYKYEILSLNGSNWTLAGAESNSTGTVFFALNNGTVAGGSGTVRRVGEFAVALTGNYLDLLDAPTLVSAFTNDVGYVSTVTLADYVTTSEVVQVVGSQIDAAIASSGTFYNVLAELSAASTNTTITTALSNRLRFDVGTQNLNAQQKINAVTNLGLADVAVSGSYNDLTDLPTTFEILPATGSTLGGVIIGPGLLVDNTGRISADTSTVKVEMVGLEYNNPAISLKGTNNQQVGQLNADRDYQYLVTSQFNPGQFTTNQAATTNTNVITTIASQWLASIDNAKATYQSGQWSLYNTSKTVEYAVTNISTSAGVGYFTISDPTGVTYTSGQQFFVQTTDTVNRIAVMDQRGTAKQSISGLPATTVSGTVTLPSGQTNGTTATLMTIDCTDVTYGELALSFTDSNNTEYYKGTLEIHLYPDNTYIVQPNLAGNKTDRIAVGFSSGANTPFALSSSIKIPVYNTDVSVQTNLTQSTCAITNIKYSWLLRTNI